MKVDVDDLKTDINQIKTDISEMNSLMVMLLGSVQMIVGSMQMQTQELIDKQVPLKVFIDGSTQTVVETTSLQKRDQLINVLQIKEPSGLVPSKGNSAVQYAEIVQKQASQKSIEKTWWRNEKIDEVKYYALPNRYNNSAKDCLQDTTYKKKASHNSASQWSLRPQVSQVVDLKDIQKEQQNEEQNIDKMYEATCNVMNLFCKLNMSRGLSRQLFHRAMRNKDNKESVYTYESIHKQLTTYVTPQEAIKLMDGTADDTTVMKVLAIVCPEDACAVESLKYYK